MDSPLKLPPVKIRVKPEADEIKAESKAEETKKEKKEGEAGE